MQRWLEMVSLPLPTNTLDLSGFAIFAPPGLLRNRVAILLNRCCTTGLYEWDTLGARLVAALELD